MKGIANPYCFSIKTDLSVRLTGLVDLSVLTKRSYLSQCRLNPVQSYTALLRLCSFVLTRYLVVLSRGSLLLSVAWSCTLPGRLLLLQQLLDTELLNHGYTIFGKNSIDTSPSRSIEI